MTWVRSKKLSARPSRPIDAPAEMNVCVRRGDPGRSSCRSGRRDCHSLVKLQLAICSISTTPLAVCYANCSKVKNKQTQTHIAAQRNILGSRCYLILLNLTKPKMANKLETCRESAEQLVHVDNSSSVSNWHNGKGIALHVVFVAVHNLTSIGEIRTVSFNHCAVAN